MFGFFRSLFRKRTSAEEEREKLIGLLEQLTGHGKGEATFSQQFIGTLLIPSHVLLLGDPQYLPVLEISCGTADQVSISASLKQYPNATWVAELQMNLGLDLPIDSQRELGRIAIDSAKMVAVDKKDHERHWTKVGKDRIGVVSIARDDKLVHELMRRFAMRFVQVDSVSAEAVEPVSEALESKINEYLRSVRRYRELPFMHFSVQTNNSFERVNYFRQEWGFLPVGNEETPLMFVCQTGYGDGTYPVLGHFARERLVRLSIRFVDADS